MRARRLSARRSTRNGSVVDPGPNLEARARDARYDALERAAAATGATAVLVGHTADDQAETVLLNLLRGSASGGLGAMARRRDGVVRPMLASAAPTPARCARRSVSSRSRTR